jgi:salicylate hydroxylase
MRQQMFADTPTTFTGIIAWRGLVPMHRLPPELQRPVGTNWLGPGGHVITYPLRRGEILNFVGFGERADWKLESWTERGTHEECAGDFRDWHPLVHEIIRNVDQPFKWALVGRDPLPRWSEGRATLLGDACHPTLPFLAQGAIMAIEDGLVLARCLDAIGDVPAALKRYEALRIERTTKIVLGSSANSKRFHNPVLAEPAAAVHYVENEWAPEKVRLRYDWLFEYDATKIAI